MQFQASDLQKRYEEITAHVDCECTVATKLVGGQPAGEKGVRAFVEHHLKLTGEEADNAVKRILKEEIGEQNITPINGELQEKRIYGVNVLRRTEFGPYLGDWMIKACIKQAASRVGLFQQQRGSKGNFAEAGRVTALGASLRDPLHPNHIYLTNSSADLPAHTHFEEFMGRVQSPAGPTSIVHHSEVVDPGSHFSFRFHFMRGKVQQDDVLDVFSMALVCGLGSVRSLECGKFKIDNLSLELGKERNEPDKKKKEKS